MTAQENTDTQDDLNRLLGTGLGVAQEQLKTHGGFLPFSLVIEHDGEVRMVAVAPDDAEDEEDDVDADVMVADLTELLRQHRDEYRAAALVCDVSLAEEGVDGIHVSAEHADGSTVSVVQPYEAAAEKEFSYAELIGEAGERTVWTD